MLLLANEMPEQYLSQLFKLQGLQLRQAEQQQLLLPGANCCKSCPPFIIT